MDLKLPTAKLIVHQDNRGPVRPQESAATGDSISTALSPPR